MSHHINLGGFSRTISSRQTCFLPKIDKGEAQLRRNDVNYLRNAPAPSKLKKDMGKTIPNRRNETPWEYTYRPKAKKGEKSKTLFPPSGGIAVVPPDWTLNLRQAVDEEGAYRRLLIANEVIERQHLNRMTQKWLPGMNETFTKNEERGIRLLESKDYGGAHVCFTRALRQNPQSRIACYKRALCNWHLLLFDECIEDSRKVFNTNLDLVSLLCRSLIFRERYQEASEWYNYALQELAPSPSDPHNVKWQIECEAIPALREFRNSVKEKRWENMLRLKDTAKPLIDGTPLLLLEARGLLYVNPNVARFRLLSYLPTITPPSSANTENSWEEKALWRCVDEHYLQASVLLAQASVYCGSSFLDLAAALVQTCLTIRPSFGPALVLGHYLVSVEEILSRVASLFAKGRYAEAIPFIHDGLELDKSNRLMCSTLHYMRAEAYAQLGKSMNVINDCTAAIAMDPNCAKAFVLRGEAYYQMDQLAESAKDRLAAVRLDPTLRHILRGDEEKFVPQSQLPEPPTSPRGKTGFQKRWAKWYDAFATHDEIPSFEPRVHGNDASKGAEHSFKAKSETTTAATTTKRTLYDILELPQGAGVSDVRSQFKKLTLLYHPDRLVKETVATQQAALERFKLINHAHDVLTDLNEKFVYDRSLGLSVFPGL